jgi:predicted RNA binding protein YcfA (HicA-like mRNA interferase family)
MRIPRDLTGSQLIKALRIFGYEPTRQSGSHIRLTTTTSGTHHLTIPNHRPLRIGTLASILDEVANHHRITRDELLAKLKL